MRPDQGLNNCAQVPLSDILLDVPEGIRLTIDWPNDGGVVGRSSYMPIGRYCHEASAWIRKLEKERVALRDAINLILPLAKGYAAAHPVGSNQSYVEHAEQLAYVGPEESRPQKSRPQESRPQESRPQESRPQESRPQKSSTEWERKLKIYEQIKTEYAAKGQEVPPYLEPDYADGWKE